MTPETPDTPASAQAPRLFALDARQFAMLDAMGVRLDWMADLQRISARAARESRAELESPEAGQGHDQGQAQPAATPTRADPPGAAPAFDARQPDSLDRVAPPPRADVPARHDARAAPPQPAKAQPQSPAGTAAQASSALMPGAQTLLADSPRHLHGSAQASGGWLVVADMAPDALGRHATDPLSGDEGRLLDAMLRALQLHAGTAPVHLVRLHRGAAQAGEGMPRAWDEVYASEMTPLAPRVVLALGPLAAQTLLRREGPIGKLRGQAQPLDDSGTAQVVASYHPAFLLKNAPAKAKAWADLCLAASCFDA